MTERRLVAASRRQVWDVLADGWTYSQWVVGNSRMRAVDENWPAPQAVIKHSIGMWPLVIDDLTIVRESNPQDKLVLLAKLGWFGAADITLQLSDSPDGCWVEMTEVPVEGLIARIPDRLAVAAVSLRNRECLWRLAALAERHQSHDVD